MRPPRLDVIPHLSRALATRAPAKVNLTLQVRGRRTDGYHELESLVAFAGVADRLTLVPGPGLSISTDGPTAPDAGPAESNLVIRAARALAERVPGILTGHFALTKRLPAAAGIGGGSSDAAAALRLLARANGLPADHPSLAEAARATGADVPVCLDPRARMMRGIGERLGPPLGLRLFALLVNPRVAVPTPAVFRGLGLEPGATAGLPDHVPVEPGLGGRDLIRIVADGRNDLQAPARALAPGIGQALDRLADTAGCRVARMSGSGATVFGLYDDRHATVRAARQVRALAPSWWVVPTLLR